MPLLSVGQFKRFLFGLEVTFLHPATVSLVEQPPTLIDPTTTPFLAVAFKHEHPSTVPQLLY